MVDLSDKSTSLDFAGLGLLGIGRVPNQANAQRLADFLGVPLEKVSPTGGILPGLRL